MWDSDVSYLLRAMNEENSWKTWHLTGSRKMPPTTAWTSFRAICTAFVGTGEAKEVRIWTDWCCKIGAVRCSIFWHLFRLKVTLRSPKFLFEAGHSEVAQLRWVQSGHAWVLPTKHTQDLFFRFRKDFGFCFSLCDISNAYCVVACLVTCSQSSHLSSVQNHGWLYYQTGGGHDHGNPVQ